MSKSRIIPILVVALAVLVIPALAQTSTQTPMPNATTAPVAAATTVRPASNQSAAVDHIRIVYLSTDGPVLTPYVNGTAGSIQVLTPLNITGWIELPAGTSLSIMDQSTNPYRTAVPPLNLGNVGKKWTTLAVLSTGDGRFQSFAFNENFALIPDGCARITVVQAVPGGSGLDVGLDNGTMLTTGIGSSTQANNQTVGIPGACAANTSAQGTTGTPAVGQTQTNAANPVGSLNCLAVQTSAANQSKQNTASLGSAGNCATTFDIPAGMYNLNFFATGNTSSPIIALPGTQLNTNTYYLVAVVGSPGSEKAVIFPLEGSRLTGLINSQNAQTQAVQTNKVNEISPSTEATPEATP